MSNRLIEAHLEIYNRFHKPEGLTLEESKQDWFELLVSDPLLSDRLNWGDLVDLTFGAGERAEFREWLKNGSAEQRAVGETIAVLGEAEYYRALKAATLNVGLRPETVERIVSAFCDHAGIGVEQ